MTGVSEEVQDNAEMGKIPYTDHPVCESGSSAKKPPKKPLLS